MAAPDRWSALQARPSRWESLQMRSPDTLAPPGADQSALRRQAENYNTATRLLRSQARRGDGRSALEAIKLQDQAMEQGYAPGGIRRKDEFDAGILGRIDATRRGAIDREKAIGLNRQAAATMDGEAAPVAGAPPIEEMGVGATVQPETRTTAALDMLEGQSRGNSDQIWRGADSAERLGVENPSSMLGGDVNTRFRKTLDSALGQARSPAEVAMLRARGTGMGVTGPAFDSRAQWWNRRRPI